jgi:hypothetical protein
VDGFAPRSVFVQEKAKRYNDETDNKSGEVHDVNPYARRLRLRPAPMAKFMPKLIESEPKPSKCLSICRTHKMAMNQVAKTKAVIDASEHHTPQDATYPWRHDLSNWTPNVARHVNKSSNREDVRHPEAAVGGEIVLHPTANVLERGLTAEVSGDYEALITNRNKFGGGHGS